MSKTTNDSLTPVWHRMLYSCTHKAAVGIKGLIILRIDTPVEPSGINVIRMALTKKVHSCTRWRINDPIRTVRALIDNGGTSLTCTDKGCWLTATFFPISRAWHQTPD